MRPTSAAKPFSLWRGSTLKPVEIFVSPFGIPTDENNCHKHMGEIVKRFSYNWQEKIQPAAT